MTHNVNWEPAQVSHHEISTYDPSAISGEEAAAALDPRVGAGTPETAPHVPVAVPWLQRQPVAALVILALIPTATAAVAELASRTTDPLVLIGLGGVSAVIAVGGALVRNAVTPVARPRLDADTPLTP